MEISCKKKEKRSNKREETYYSMDRLNFLNSFDTLNISLLHIHKELIQSLSKHSHSCEPS